MPLRVSTGDWVTGERLLYAQFTLPASYDKTVLSVSCLVHPCWGEVKIKKVKFSHTRYRALGPELIPVYRQSALR